MLLIVLLYPFQLLYRLGFLIVTWYKRKRCRKDPFTFNIISVGNLSVGGTGKSVVVPFLVHLFGESTSAIVLRGYKGSCEKLNQATLVSDGTTIMVSRSACGDEAMMYAQSLHVPVVVGRDRAQSCVLLEELSRLGRTPLQYVILDDAYQNYAVKKDLEILLLDARAPFDNGHCIPCGRLREKDFSRANVIILTHADSVDSKRREQIKTVLLAGFPTDHIVSGRHAVEGLYHLNKTRCDDDWGKAKKVLVVAAVGSFGGVVASVKQARCMVAATREYGDHYCYTEADVTAILKELEQKNLDGIVTTAKDWVKLEPLLSKHPQFLTLPIFVIRVVFEFLSSQEYDIFVESVRHKIRTSCPR